MLTQAARNREKYAPISPRVKAGNRAVIQRSLCHGERRSKNLPIQINLRHRSHARRWSPGWHQINQPIMHLSRSPGSAKGLPSTDIGALLVKGAAGRAHIAAHAAETASRALANPALQNLPADKANGCQKQGCHKNRDRYATEQIQQQASGWPRRQQQDRGHQDPEPGNGWALHERRRLPDTILD